MPQTAPAWRRLATARRRAPGTRRNGNLTAGLTILGLALLISAVGHFALPDPLHQDLTASLAAPGTGGHLLGTDPLGRDVFAWIAASVPLSLAIAVATVCLSSVVGVVVGIAAGFMGGVVDALLMRLVELSLAIPPLLLFLSASAIVGTGTLKLILLVSAVSWVPYARIVRTQVQLERRRPSIAAARLAGLTRRRIVVRHIVPSIATFVLVLASLQAGYVFLWEASLSFVGLGVQPPQTSLGFLMAQGRLTLAVGWWVVVFPGAMLAALLLAANLVGDGLRDKFGLDLEDVR
ncbi:MAG TPA: ABC transporter permease [Baekduia sp.]|uniref:ABC transporter permease n=1 Tax=Baekduia sp. TaxID=2600305 RepID=UPI002D770533|nr:ABC transporter permease [Baekduia sp.]HET6507839.1 ABC transporter permease [Baekduia sp.]